jgi:hypothetical protein
MPRVTFGTIVLNGEPFVRYHLRSLYPFAHQIIVVEGAVTGAASISRPDGHSRDGTLETLRRFQAEEDPERKLLVVTAEDAGHPDGFWRGEKDEQSRAYAERAGGDYLWQVDVDEFYTAPAMGTVLGLLRAQPEVSAVSFPMLTFWSSPHICVDGWYLMRGAGEYHRLFRWGPGYSYATHRPPTVLDEAGRDTRDGCWLRARDLAAHGVLLYHYSLLFPAQVRDKVAYYRGGFPDGQRFRELESWYRESYLTLRRPYRVHNVYDSPSWLQLFGHRHPEQVRAMWDDVVSGRLPVAVRGTADADRLLSTRWYGLGRGLLRRLERPDRLTHELRAGLGTVAPASVKRVVRHARALLGAKGGRS